MQLRRISSLFTVFNKFILPAIFVIGFVNVLFFFDRQRISDPRNLMPDWVTYLIPVFFLYDLARLGIKVGCDR